MDDNQINQNAPVGGPASPGLGGPVPPPPPGVGVPPPPPPPVGGADPHAQVMAALSRIEAKLAEIAAKLGV